MRRALLLLAILGCDARKEPAAASRTFADDRGRSVAVPSPPRRIVSIVPSTTELLFAAGAGEQVAGVTSYCLWPPEAKDKPKVGSLLLDFEKIASLKADLILTSWAVAKKSTMELEEKGYPVFSVDPHTFEDIARAIRTLGAMTGHGSEAEMAASSLEARVRAVKPGRNPTFYFEHSADPMGTAGPESYVGDALRRAGGRNVFEGGWKLIDWESVLARDPEVILISHDSREGLSRRAGWANLKAVKGGRVHFVRLESFLYPTPRLVDGLEEAARIFNDKSP